MHDPRISDAEFVLVLCDQLQAPSLRLQLLEHVAFANDRCKVGVAVIFSFLQRYGDFSPPFQMPLR